MNANEIVNELLGDSEVRTVLLEDRVSELAARLGIDVEKVKEIAGCDPTRTKKYLPWLALRWKDSDQAFSDSAQIMDTIKQFERLLKLPAFKGSKDIQTYSTISELMDEVHRAEGLESGKEKMLKGAKVISKFGDLTLIEISNPAHFQTLIWYGTQNILDPVPAREQQGHEEGQTNWCTRFPDHAKSHLRSGTFYIVLKRGKTYLAIHPASGSVKNTDQHKAAFSSQQANEIVPLISQELLQDKGFNTFKGDMQMFINVVDLPDGSTIEGSLDYSHTKGKRIPNDLTVNGSLNLEGSDSEVLPARLVVKATLNIKGTKIVSLNNCLYVSRLEHDENFPFMEVVMLAFRSKKPQMREKFIARRVTTGYREKNELGEYGTEMPPISREEAEAQWPSIEEDLQHYYLSLETAEQDPDPVQRAQKLQFRQRVMNEIS
jgi:hypothetical protein